MKDLHVVGKTALCAHLGWSRPTLDKRLKTDPDFPVISRGDRSGGWQFSVQDVDEYLRGGSVTERVKGCVKGRVTSPAAASLLAIRPEQLASKDGLRDVAAYVSSLMLWPDAMAHQVAWRVAAGALAARQSLLAEKCGIHAMSAADVVNFGERLAQIYVMVPEARAQLERLKRCGLSLCDYLDSAGWAGFGIRYRPTGLRNNVKLTLSQALLQNANILKKGGERAHLESRISREKTWSKFRPVVHFGAALINFQITSPPIDLHARMLPCSVDLLPFFLKRAELIRREAVRAGLPKASEMLALPADVCESIVTRPGELDDPVLWKKF